MSSASPSASASAGAHSDTIPSQYRPVGIVLAVSSGILIGSSFVLKKKGLIASQKDGVAGEGVAYLKSAMWWTGMIMMILGEILNFGAYAFIEAIVVTPLGSLSVVVCAIMSSFFLNEKLSTFGWMGCIQCILGSVIIALNGPKEQSVTTISEFKELFLAPGFLGFGAAVILASLIIIFYFGPRYGDTQMLWYISVCSLIGGLSVSCIQGLGASIVTSIRGNNQFKNWFIYFVIAFCIITLLTEVYYLNKALALFNTAMVSPIYFVTFTFATLVTSVILYQGLNASAHQIITVVLALLVICSGIVLLQMSKVDPRKLSVVDRKSTILLEAARQEIAPPNDDPDDLEKATAVEEPGLDAIRGTFGAVGSIVRLRRRATILSQSDHGGRSRRGTVTTMNGTMAPMSEKGLNSPARQDPQRLGPASLSLSDGSSSRYFEAREEEPTIETLLMREQGNHGTPFQRVPSIQFSPDTRDRKASIRSGQTASPVLLPAPAITIARPGDVPGKGSPSPPTLHLEEPRLSSASQEPEQTRSSFEPWLSDKDVSVSPTRSPGEGGSSSNANHTP